MEVALDLNTRTAHVLRQWDRPDGGLTKLRGNAQRLPSDNMFICWSENSYMSEHTADGEMIMEAQLASHRLVSYRAYKMHFTAQPSEPIALKTFVYGVDLETSTTVTYVSWNGATEVAQWNFYDVHEGRVKHLGMADKTGFETVFMTAGASYEVVVEALDAHGQSLGKSEVSEARLPPSWAGGDNSTGVSPTYVDDLDDALTSELDKQTSVSEDLSTHLHHAASQVNGHVDSSENSNDVAIHADPLIFVSFATLSLFVTIALAIRHRRNRISRPDTSNYKAIKDDV